MDRLETLYKDGDGRGHGTVCRAENTVANFRELYSLSSSGFSVDKRNTLIASELIIVMP